MSNLAEIILPELFELDELEVLQTLTSSKNEKLGILIARENVNGIKQYNPTIRIYLTHRNEGKFEVVKELEAYSFQTQEEGIEFSKKLSTMSAIELILLLNHIEL